MANTRRLPCRLRPAPCPVGLTRPRRSVGGDDDEDALSFFANTNGPAGAADDDDMGMGSGGGGGGASGAAKGGSPKKGARKRPSEVGADGQPKPKKKRRTKAEASLPLIVEEWSIWLTVLIFYRLRLLRLRENECRAQHRALIPSVQCRVCNHRHACLFYHFRDVSPEHVTFASQVIRCDR